MSRAIRVRLLCGAWIALGLLAFAIGWWPRRVPDWLVSVLHGLPDGMLKSGTILAIAANLAVTIWLMRHCRTARQVPLSVAIFFVGQLSLWTSGISPFVSFDAHRSFGVLLLFLASACAFAELQNVDEPRTRRRMAAGFAACSVAAVFLQYIVEQSLSS